MTRCVFAHRCACDHRHFSAIPTKVFAPNHSQPQKHLENMAPDESRAQIAVWSPGLNLSPASLELVGCVAGTIRVTWTFTGFPSVWFGKGHGAITLSSYDCSHDQEAVKTHHHSSRLCYTFDSDHPHFSPAHAACGWDAFVVLFAQFLSHKSRQSWKETKSSIHCKMLVIYCERANHLGDFDQWVWWNIICWKCFIWDTKTMPKRSTHDRTSLLINVERFCKDFISKLHGYTIPKTHTQSYCHLYCGWTPARNICISQPWLLIIKVHVKQRIIKEYCNCANVYFKIKTAPTVWWLGLIKLKHLNLRKSVPLE